MPYRNPGAGQLIHIATRLTSSLQLSGDFGSVQSRHFMQFEHNRFSRLHEIDCGTDTSAMLEPIFSDKILLLRPYPGLDYSRINPSGTDAILHDLYHSGTACCSYDYGNRHCLLEFIDNCLHQGIKVYLAPAQQHSDVYRSTRQLIEHGAEMIWNMSLETAYVKLLLAYGNFREPKAISIFLQQDIAWEHV